MAEQHPQTVTVAQELRSIWCDLLDRQIVRDSDSFFNLGGHSMLAMRLAARAAKRFKCSLELGDVFDTPVFEDMVKLLAERSQRVVSSQNSAIEIGPRPERIPLSFAQQRIWFLDQLGADPASYIMAGALILRGDIDAEALNSAIRIICRRHEILRTTFYSESGTAYQKIHPDPLCRLEVNTLSGTDAQKQAQVEELLRRGALEAFDLRTGPLLRARLYSLNPKEHHLLISMHHIISDGWSIAVMFTELFKIYHAFAHGDGQFDLPPLPLQYADFSLWQREFLQGDTLRQQIDYWREQLAGISQLPILPTDRPRPDVLTFSGKQLDLRLDADLARQLRGVEQFGVSPFMFMLAVHGLVLQRWSNTREVVTGTVIANRTRAELEPLIGFFVNTLCMRLRSRAGQTFREYLDAVREVCYGAFTHQELPFERLVEELKPKRDPSFTPIFQSLFSFNNAPQGVRELSGLEVEQREIDLDVSKFELTVNCIDNGQDFALNFEYNTALFDDATIRALMQRFVQTLRDVLTDLDQPVDALSMLTPQEVKTIDKLNTVDTALPETVYFDQLFAQQAQKCASALAVHDSAREWTYQEIDQMADRLARHLLQRGARLEDRVIMALPRCGQAIISIIAIMRAGCVYVPIDLQQPSQRLTHIIQDSAAKFIIAAENLNQDVQISSAELLIIDDVLSSEEGPDDYTVPDVTRHPLNLAYSIYTSGTTGQPKAVLLTHAGLGALLVQGRSKVPVTSDDRVHNGFSFVFDASIWMSAKALCAGASLFLSDSRDDLPGITLNNYLRQHAITYMTVTPSMAAITPPENLPDLRLIGFGAEEVTPEVAAAWQAPGRELYNVYGPTEVTICSLAQYIDAGMFRDSEPRRLPIGTPFSFLKVFVIDGAMRQTPVGVDGELLIGGSSLARAYGNNPQLTALSFIPNPFSSPDNQAGERLYRSGDLVRRLPDGAIEYRGRLDSSQVKVRGFRIELSEIETHLRRHDAVAQVAVVLRKTASETDIIAWLRPSAATLPDEAVLRNWLAARLPEYMLPARFIKVEVLPLLPSGKVDRIGLAKRVPPPRNPGSGAGSNGLNSNGLSAVDLAHNGKAGRPPLNGQAQEPSAAPGAVTPAFNDGKLETLITAIWREVLPDVNAGPDDNFFEIGGHSLLVVRVHALLLEQIDTDIPVVDLFRFSTIRSLAQHLRSNTGTGGGIDNPASTAGRAAPDGGRSVKADDDIAIIAMSARFPQAANVQEYWENVRDGRDCISHFSKEELMGQGLPPAMLADMLEDDAFVPAKGVIPDADLFDADFFNMTPLEARLMAPHHRLFLEVVWECLESAAYAKSNQRERIGLFAGGGYNTYQKFMLDANPELRAAVGEMQYGMGNEKDFLATFASYKLNLRGPSINVQNACSTSLVALHLACRALQNGDAEMALAGGATVHAPLRGGYRHEEGMIYSPDGRCRPFSDQAGGTVGSDGVVAVLLKPLAKALEDGDTVHAVIKGSAVNNDGRDKVGFTAPGVDGQAAVISAALADAGLEPADISYIETHGTATVLGDPIEIAALNKVYGGQVPKNQRLALASVKSNIGHTDTAAGLAGVVKTVMALKNAQLPPSLHFEKANPKIDFAKTPFYVNTSLRDWPSNNQLRRAGVSSFGIGGTNAHVILQEFEPQNPKPQNAAAPAVATPDGAAPPPAAPHALNFMLSAKTPAALKKMRAALAAHLESNNSQKLNDIAASLAGGRPRFRERWVARANSTTELIQRLRDEKNNGALLRTETRSSRAVMFMFSGQGAQYAGMARSLYNNDAAFRELIDAQAAIVNPLLRGADPAKAKQDFDIRALLFPQPVSTVQAQRALTETAMAQPALFMIEFALAQRLMQFGLQAAALVGHSIGMYCAAVLAGVMSLEDGLRLVVDRGRLMQKMQPGTMLTVMLPAQALQEHIAFTANHDIGLAAINTPDTCVISGPTDQIDAARNELEKAGIECRKLHTSHAFHSGMMSAAAREFHQICSTTALHAPQIPLLLDVKAGWMDAATAQSADTWSGQLLQTVQFADCLEKLFENPDAILLEVGPGNALKSLALRHSSRPSSVEVLDCLPHARQAESDAREHLYGRLAGLWSAGADLDFFAVFAGAARVPLPTYPFERIRHWVDAKPGAGPNKKIMQSSERSVEQDIVFERNDDVAQWIWRLDWERMHTQRPEGRDYDRNNVLFLCEAGDHDQDSNELRERFRAHAFPHIIQFHGTARQPQGLADECLGDSIHLDDSRALHERFKALEEPPKLIIYTLLIGKTARAAIADAKERKTRAFNLLQSIGREIDRLGWTQALELIIVTQERYNVVGTETIEPDHALCAGPLKVMPQELANLKTRLLDIPTGEFALSGLMENIFYPRNEQILALRGKYTWRQQWRKVELNSPADVDVLGTAQSTFVITGGFGAMGQAFGALLAEKLQANIILISRRAFPARAEWPKVDGRNGQRETAFQIKELQRWESLGAQLKVVQADVSDADALQTAFAEIKAEYGNLTGVIHTAGVAGGRSMLLQTSDEADAVFAPKVEGLLNLHAAMEKQDLKPKFLAICSSMAALLGGFGQLAYTAANDWQNAFAQSLAPPVFWDMQVVALDWGQWRDAGMAANATVPEEFRTELEENLRTGITSAEGAEALVFALASGYEQVVINPYDFRPLLTIENVLERSTKASGEDPVVTAPEVQVAVSGSVTPDDASKRPELWTPYEAPAGEIEERVSAIWTQLLGVHGIGRNDDFFELGGHSLLATRVVTRLRENFEIDVTLGQFFDAPTIAGLAQTVHSARQARLLQSPIVQDEGEEYEEGEL